jgi:hypothetical protein
MKKLLLFAALFIYGIVQAQDITVNVEGGGTIENNEIFTFNTLDTSSKLTFTVTNNTDEILYLKTRVDEMSGTNGSDVQLCFGVCLYNLSQGLTVPSFLIEIPANSTTESTDDHIWNYNPGDGTTPIVYTISFVKYDAQGNELGNLITFTYRYVPTASTEDFAALEKAGIALESTIITNALKVSAQQNAAVTFYGTNGQVVKNAAITTGEQVIDMSGIATGVYIAKFTTADNKTAQLRVVKQ